MPAWLISFGIKYGLKILAVLAFIAALAGIYHYIYEQGVTAEHTVMQAKADSADKAAKIKLDAANASVKSAQDELNKTIAQLNDKMKELQDAKDTAAKLNADLLTSKRRMFASVRASSCSAAEQGKDGTIADGTSESYVDAELSPEDAAAIQDYASTADIAVVAFNQCRSRYNAAMTAVNAINKE